MAHDTDRIWQEFHSGLRAFVAKRVRSKTDVDDILQEVFLRIHRHIEGVKNPRRVVSWMFQITRHAMIDYYRHPGRRREVPLGLAVEMEQDEHAVASAPTLGPGPDALREELAACLRPMIERLPDQYREAVVLVELEGKTMREAAERRGLSLSGMKSRVQRGRQKLKALLEDCCMIELDRRGSVTDYEARDSQCSPCDQPRGHAREQKIGR